MSSIRNNKDIIICLFIIIIIIIRYKTIKETLIPKKNLQLLGVNRFQNNKNIDRSETNIKCPLIFLYKETNPNFTIIIINNRKDKKKKKRLFGSTD